MQKKKGRIQRDKLKLYEAFQQTSSMPTQKPALGECRNGKHHQWWLGIRWLLAITIDKGVVEERNILNFWI